MESPPPNDQGNAEFVFTDYHEEEYLKRLVQEGGVELQNYLFSQSIPLHEDELVLFETDIENFASQMSDDPSKWSSQKHYKHLDAKTRQAWDTACKEEIDGLKKRKVFEEVKLPHGRKPIRCRWVFNRKSDSRYKARLVAKGFSQIEGVDYNELFSPVARFEMVRTLLALAALEDWEIQALDVKQAFLYGKLDEEIYMEQPEGFIKDKTKVWRLRRALYGLKQASISWWKECNASMGKLGFKRCFSDAGVYVFKEKQQTVVAIIYVDDALFMGSDKNLVHKKKNEFMKMWECRDLGEPKEFLGMQITRDRSKRILVLDQRAYLEKVIARFGMTNAKEAHTPLPSSWTPRMYKGPEDPELRRYYQSIIGSLLYLMLGTRPDIAYAVIKLSQYSANPSKDHLSKGIHIIRYLIHTRNYKIVFDGNSLEGFLAHSDSDWASDPDDRRSHTGMLVQLANGPISWVSHKQKTVALSSTEAEYMALSDSCRQLIWLKSLFAEIGCDIESLPLLGDNQGSEFLASNPIQERRTKHIDIRYHYIREKIESGDVQLYYVPSNDNVADIFTKNLALVNFKRCRDRLGLIFN